MVAREPEEAEGATFRQLISRARFSGKELEEKKGSCCWGVAISTTEIVDAIVRNTKVVLPASTHILVSRGEKKRKGGRGGNSPYTPFHLSSSLFPFLRPQSCAHGTDKDVYMSVPCVIGREGVYCTVRQKLTEQEKAAVQTCADNIRNILRESGILQETNNEAEQ